MIALEIVGTVKCWQKYRKGLCRVSCVSSLGPHLSINKIRIAHNDAQYFL